MRTGYGAYLPKVAQTSALQAAATARRLCQTTHARQHTIASPSVICVNRTHMHTNTVL